MILYSIIPVNIVFDNFNYKQETDYFDAEYFGEKIQVSRLDNDRFQVVRLLSTAPQAYLNPGLQPGSIINGSNLSLK